jgi:hypothetical protein
MKTSAALSHKRRQTSSNFARRDVELGTPTRAAARTFNAAHAALRRRTVRAITAATRRLPSRKVAKVNGSEPTPRQRQSTQGATLRGPATEPPSVLERCLLLCLVSAPGSARAQCDIDVIQRTPRGRARYKEIGSALARAVRLQDGRRACTTQTDDLRCSFGALPRRFNLFRFFLPRFWSGTARCARGTGKGCRVSRGGAVAKRV